MVHTKNDVYVSNVKAIQMEDLSTSFSNADRGNGKIKLERTERESDQVNIHGLTNIYGTLYSLLVDQMMHVKLFKINCLLGHTG